MIDSISLSNFKAFRSSSTLTLKPITVLCGANSSGKTSLIQAMLLMKQTLESQSPTRTLVANSRFVKLGSFDTFVSGRDATKDLSLGFVVEIPVGLGPRGIRPQSRHYPLRRVRHYFDLGSNPVEAQTQGQSAPTRHFLSAEYVLRARSLSPLFSPESGSRDDEHLPVHPAEETFVKRASFSGFCRLGNMRSDGFSLTFTHKTGNRYDLSWQGVYGFRGQNRTRDSQGRKTTDLSFVNLMPTPMDPGTEAQAGSLEVPLEAMTVIRWVLTAAFESLSYLGPLREQPARKYLYEDEVVEIGTKGENVPFILAVQSQRPVPPFYMASDLHVAKWHKHTGKTLASAVEAWLRYMAISPTISSGMSEGIGYLDLSASMTSDTKVSIADVGFGVSQILPIIVEGLRLGAGETMILEQPEIHLHPAMQLKLADFLVSMVLSDKRLVVETHSDHIVNRLVRRVVEDREYSLNEKIGLFFIEPGMEGATIREVCLHGDRGIVNWPIGFFDQVADEHQAIIEAGIAKRQGM